MNLPGLNIDPAKYEIVNIICGASAGQYRQIPFSDWFPPDFEDVYCSRGNGLKLMYFSPSTVMMLPSDTEWAGWPVKPSDLTFWLRPLKWE